MRLRGRGESWPFGIAGPCGGEGGTKCCHRLGNLGLSADTPAGPGGLGGGRERRGSRVSRLPFLTRRPQGQPAPAKARSPSLAPKGNPTPAGPGGRRTPRPLTAALTPQQGPPAPCAHLLRAPTPCPTWNAACSPLWARVVPEPSQQSKTPPLLVSRSLRQHAPHSLPASHRPRWGEQHALHPTQSEPQVRDSNSRLSLTGQGPERLLGLRLPFCKIEPTTQLTVMSQHPARWMSPHCLGPPLPLPTSQAPRSSPKPDTHVAKVSSLQVSPPR